MQNSPNTRVSTILLTRDATTHNKVTAEYFCSKTTQVGIAKTASIEISGDLVIGTSDDRVIEKLGDRPKAKSQEDIG
jgi:hypothetical protein